MEECCLFNAPGKSVRKQAGGFGGQGPFSQPIYNVSPVALCRGVLLLIV